MTGAILGGSSVQQAARLQMIIIFMISSSTTLATVFITFSCIAVIVDNKHRIRCDRIIDNSSSSILSKKRSSSSFGAGKEGGLARKKGFFGRILGSVVGGSVSKGGKGKGKGKEEGNGSGFTTQGERRPLLA
jgi:hypothetical protein